MNRKLVFHRLARNELTEILSFYDEQSDRAGNLFLNEIESVIHQAMEDPERWPSFSEKYRRANLDRFPYQLIYRATERQFKVVMIRHNKRHPRYGFGRLS